MLSAIILDEVRTAEVLAPWIKSTSSDALFGRAALDNIVLHVRVEAVPEMLVGRVYSDFFCTIRNTAPAEVIGAAEEVFAAV